METLVHYFSLVLEVLFFVGMAGSAVVVLMTTIEDAEVFFKKEELPPLASSADPEKNVSSP